MSPPLKRGLSVVVAGDGSYTSVNMNFCSPGFQSMPARGVNPLNRRLMTLLASAAVPHHAGAELVPQKNCQLLRVLSARRRPRIRVKAGTSVYALLLTSPCVSECIGMIEYT